MGSFEIYSGSFWQTWTVDVKGKKLNASWEFINVYYWACGILGEKTYEMDLYYTRLVRALFF